MFKEIDKTRQQLVWIFSVLKTKGLTFGVSFFGIVIFPVVSPDRLLRRHNTAIKATKARTATHTSVKRAIS